ncbi:hypothetical protein MRB53_002046 [Persea americana]|uniref:Uncharacterized protein n=1 Tax=Persea americana TaxID=3435 RepID=A0ACC2MU13_PERAE|nr:hypothetical protein MRB53_002046 [Persea americana]
METEKNPREHIEEIRRVKFSIGGKPNPVMEDLHQAVKNLSAELYAKDVHFLMELIQRYLACDVRLERFRSCVAV